MVRVCIPIGHLKMSALKNSSYSFSGCKACIEIAKLIFDATQPSSLILGGSEERCLNLIAKNLTDVSYGLYKIEDESFYSVPTVQGSTTLGFISGYEVNEYIESQSNRSYSKFGLLENVTAFNGSVYLTILLLFVTMWLTKWAFKLNNRRIILRRKMYHLTRKTRPRPRGIMFLASVSVFLISTPFFSLFKTFQVVTERPNVIVDYESLIKSNASIVSFFTVNAESYLKPSTMSTKTDNWAFRLYNYYHGGHSISGKDFKSNYLEKNGLFGYFSYNYHVAQFLVERKIVIFTHHFSAKIIKDRYCSVSNEDEFFRIFVFKDRHQREILFGSAFRAQVKLPKLVARLKHLFEFGSTYPYGSQFLQYMDDYLDQKAGLVSQEHRREQKQLCMDDKIIAFVKENTFASDLEFFLAFWVLLLLLVVVSFGLVVFERCKYNFD